MLEFTDKNRNEERMHPGLTFAVEIQVTDENNTDETVSSIAIGVEHRGPESLIATMGWLIMTSMHPDISGDVFNSMMNRLLDNETVEGIATQRIAPEDARSIPTNESSICMSVAAEPESEPFGHMFFKKINTVSDIESVFQVLTNIQFLFEFAQGVMATAEDYGMEQEVLDAVSWLVFLRMSSEDATEVYAAIQELAQDPDTMIPVFADKFTSLDELARREVRPKTTPTNIPDGSRGVTEQLASARKGVSGQPAEAFDEEDLNWD